ncbi:hypothetical protein RI138_20075 [Streptomyces sp. C11-1]|uniref:Uncharacterized protein n=1 Tax=Streptomyces durocortorensis TaxID=2811104 RepID=A0ABY9W0D5_9ACTN|nr:hypothetical protein [Streptomyces durocortorensis]WNF28934.1 hypothetical protein RI138_20075 [Streptomyces durocortorensis]
MHYFEAASARDMELFLQQLAPELDAAGARTLLDLYTDEPMDAPRAQDALQAMSAIAEQASSSTRRRGSSRSRDPLMGVEVDLHDPVQAGHFALLAHRVINAEAWCGEGRQVFGTVESPTRVWVELPREVVEKLLDDGRRAGASLTVRPAG